MDSSSPATSAWRLALHRVWPDLAPRWSRKRKSLPRRRPGTTAPRLTTTAPITLMAITTGPGAGVGDGAGSDQRRDGVILKPKRRVTGEPTRSPAGPADCRNP